MRFGKWGRELLREGNFYLVLKNPPEKSLQESGLRGQGAGERIEITLPQ